MTTSTKTNKQMEAILKSLEKDLPVFAIGDMVEGIIAGRSGRRLWIDIDGRALGIVPPSEVSGNKGDLAEGKKVLSSVIDTEDENGNIVLSLRRADKKKAFWDLEKKHEKEEALFVKVIDANRGGLIVGQENFQGFLPVSELSRENYPRVEGGDKEKILAKLKDLIGKSFNVKVITFDRNEDKLIFSEKKATGALDKGSLDKIKVGKIVEAKVSGVAEFGLFVQFDNLEGLVHISEISWERVTDIQKQYKVGDKIKAKIIEIDAEKQRISLSLKRLADDPWQKKIKGYKVGQKVEGQVSRLTPFGAFISFDDNITGLIHISEISDQRINDPSEKLKLGEKITTKIISIEPEEHKIGLSIKELTSKKKPAAKKKAVAKTSKKAKLEDLVNKNVLKSLSKAGIKTLSALKKASKEKLLKIDGLGEKTVEKLKK